MTTSKAFASVVFAAVTISTLHAETSCPGNVASLPFHIVNRHQIIVAVSVNHSGPHNFLLDTGAEMTTIDPSLAADLHLTTRGATVVNGVGFEAAGSFAQVDVLEAGFHAVAKQKVLVYDLQKFKPGDLAIRGVLGEDFLEHFDMLIDNGHSMLCLDDTGAMRARMKGKPVALVAPAQAADTAATPSSLIVTARLTDGMRPVRLKLDSGSNVPFLYNTSEYMALALLRGEPVQGRGADGAQRTFTALPPQNVKIGSVEISGVSFVTLADAPKDPRTSDFDGLLTMRLFKRVFIDHADHFAVFEPW
jgi:hypothetical protein